MERINYFSQTNNMVYFMFLIDVAKSQTVGYRFCLDGHLVGKKIDVDKDELGTEVKAITWHNFYVKERVEGGFEAKVLLDI